LLVKSPIFLPQQGDVVAYHVRFRFSISQSVPEILAIKV